MYGAAVKDVRRLKLAMPAEVVVHELFDSGMLGEGVLHLLQPQAASSHPPPRMLPARAKVRSLTHSPAGWLACLPACPCLLGTAPSLH